MKKILTKYRTYILIGIIIILIIIIGFIYSDKTTSKIIEQNTTLEIEPKQKEKNINLLKVEIKGEVKNPNVYEMNENDRIIDVINKAGGLNDNANTDYLNLSKKLNDEMVIIIYSNKEIQEYEKLLNDNIPEIIEKKITKYEVIEKEIPCPNTTNNACINNENISNEKKDKKISSNNEEEANKNITPNIEETNILDSNIVNHNDDLININIASKEQLLTLPGIGESKADLIIDYRNNESFKNIEDIKNVKGIGDSLFEKIKDYITT
jgi:competence protein ComEA